MGSDHDEERRAGLVRRRPDLHLSRVASDGDRVPCGDKGRVLPLTSANINLTMASVDRECSRYFMRRQRSPVPTSLRNYRHVCYRHLATWIFARRRPLLRVKRTDSGQGTMSALDTKRTLDRYRRLAEKLSGCYDVGMRRRSFIAGIIGSAVISPLAARAQQQAGKVCRSCTFLCRALRRKRGERRGGLKRPAQLPSRIDVEGGKVAASLA